MTEHNDDDKGSTEIGQGATELKPTAPDPKQAPAAIEEARSEPEAGSAEIKEGPAMPQEVTLKLDKAPAELEKGPFEVMTEAQEAWRKLPPAHSSPPAKSLSSAEFNAQFDELYRQLVPPKAYRPASDFPEVSDPEKRADFLYLAYEMGEINLLCPDIRAVIESLAGTYHGHLLDFLIHPERREPKKPKRKKPGFKPAKRLPPPMTNLVELSQELAAVDESLPKDADED